MESKGKTIVMAVVDSILERVVWVRKDGLAVSLKDALAERIREGGKGGVEMLDRADLVGAYTSCQISRQEFSKGTREMSDDEIADEVKLFIFEDAHAQIGRIEEDCGTSAASKRKFG